MIKFRAETREQKEKVIKDLLLLWLDCPELRLAQLIKNAYHDDLEMYNVEDEVFIFTLKCFYYKKDKNEKSKT